MFLIPNNPKVVALIGLLPPVMICMFITAVLIQTEAPTLMVFLVCWASFSVISGLNVGKFDDLLGTHQVPTPYRLLGLVLVSLAYAFLAADHSGRLRDIITLVER